MEELNFEQYKLIFLSRETLGSQTFYSQEPPKTIEWTRLQTDYAPKFTKEVFDNMCQQLKKEIFGE